MKEKERKKLELIESNKKIIELREKVKEKSSPPKKDIGMLVAFHALNRSPLPEEFVEDLLGEYTSLLLRLERYGENTNFYKTSIFTYSKDSNAKSKGPSAAWLHSKVKRYESQTTI